MAWGDKIEVKKGNIGESIVKKFLEDNNFILYKPITEGSHKIDYFAHSGKEKRVICCEVKSKRRMAKYECTGFNISCYNHYIEIFKKHNIDTFVFFVDDFEQCVYGQWLSKLGEGKIIRDVIVWELNKMKKIQDITKDEIIELTKYTKENYDYSNVKKYFN